MTSSTKWTALAVVALVGVAALGLGVWWIRSPRVADQQPFPTPAPPADVGEPGLPPAEGKAAERVEVKGRVLGPDGQPVAGAKLFLRTDQVFAPAPQAVANGDGRFTFTVDADERHCTVLATAPGRGVSWRSLYPRPLPEFVFRLTPDEPIRGTVVGPTGKPVAGVSVSVESISQPARNPSLDEWLKAARDPNGGRSDSDLDWLRGSYDGFAELLPPVTTDRDGRFEIRGVGRDRIADLLVSGPAVAPDQVSVVTRKVERFTTRWKGVLETHEETYHGADLVVSTTPVPVTTGRVLDEATGQPVPGTLLRVHSRTVGTGTRPWMEVEVAADAEGRFTLPGLKLGDEGGRVQVVPPDGSPYHRLDVKVPDGAAERGRFDLKLTRGVLATVKVVDQATGKPVRASLTYNVFPDDNPNVKLVPDIWHEHSRHDSRGRFYQSAAGFRLVVFPGKGVLAAGAERSRGYLTGVGAEAFRERQTDTPWLRPYAPVPRLEGLAGGTWNSLPLGSYNRFAVIDVPADAKEFSVTLELDPGLTVSGRLVDAGGKPVVGASGYGLSPSDTRGDWTELAADATFAVTVLRPAESRRVLFVHTERELAGSVVVVGGAKGPAEVVMEPWGVVTGRLVDTDGRPVARAHPRDRYVGGDPNPDSPWSEFWFPVREGSLGPDGRFRITGLAPGVTYHLHAAGGAHRRDGRWNVGRVVSKAGETTDLGDVVIK